MKRASVFAFVALLVAACGGSVESASSSGSSPSPAAASPSVPATQEDAPPRPPPQQTGEPFDMAKHRMGVYHAADAVDATNLALEADGTFRWTIEGCDFGGGDCGVWTKNADGSLTLSAGNGRSGFFWPSKEGVGRVSSVVLGAVFPSGIGSKTPDGKTASWFEMRICAVCGSKEGPTGTKLCADPVARSCRVD